jgi:hypothetical protein
LPAKYRRGIGAIPHRVKAQCTSDAPVTGANPDGFAALIRNKLN